MPKLDGAEPHPEAGSGGLFDPRIQVPVVLELHEAVALNLLYQRAPQDIDLVDDDGIWFGESLDLAIVRICDAFAALINDKELRLQVGALRAEWEQNQ